MTIDKLPEHLKTTLLSANASGAMYCYLCVQNDDVAPYQQTKLIMANDSSTSTRSASVKPQFTPSSRTTDQRPWKARSPGEGQEQDSQKERDKQMTMYSGKAKGKRKVPLKFFSGGKAKRGRSTEVLQIAGRPDKTPETVDCREFN